MGVKNAFQTVLLLENYIYKKDPDDNICYRKEDCDYISVSGTTCLSSCGSGEFHDNNSKLCKSYCGQENTNKKYYASDGNTCYNCIFTCVFCTTNKAYRFNSLSIIYC